ncbi:MAG: stage 0 sporulation protein [Candidatus Pacebacteria bacterium]|nr:stage 0 sporulation protein [Candidatus Paceibacterota bacterium]
MKISVKIFPWDNPCIFNSENCTLNVGDMVIVNTETGNEGAVVMGINEQSDEDVSSIVRKATSTDIETIQRNDQKCKEAVRICRKLASEKELQMKIVGAHFSFDGGKIVFSFIAEKRVDFRDLVRNLSKKFQRSIRLQQIGSRDEARGKGGFGGCGRELCCVKFSGSLKSVTTEDAKAQQMGQRGSERLSGLCGRLKCCLGFEADQYRENLKKMPKIGEEVKVDNKKCKVTDLNIMELNVIVEFEDKSKIKVNIKDIK